MSRLKYLSQKTLENLSEKVPEHLDRYTSTGFEDLALQNGWAVETVGVEIDYDRLKDLRTDPTSPAVEVHNSIVVHDALKGLRRAIARDERVWARLCHVECLEYARARWLSGTATSDLEKKVRAHFFASGLTQTRDDNAIARLWWNGEIAQIAVPEDRKRALELILLTADIRLNLVERSSLGGRPLIIGGIVRALNEHPWLTDKEANFRRFMKALNTEGGGVLYEALPSSSVDKMMGAAILKAQRATEVNPAT